MTLTVDLDTLEGRHGKRCDLDHTGPVTPETARRILCDADITRVITDGDSEILDLGRATRTPSPALRKALHLRDGHCRFRGCDRPRSSVMPTTSSPGCEAATPASTISSCSAAVTTPSSMKDGRS